MCSKYWLLTEQAIQLHLVYTSALQCQISPLCRCKIAKGLSLYRAVMFCRNIKLLKLHVSLLFISFLLHVKYTVSYCIVALIVVGVA